MQVILCGLIESAHTGDDLPSWPLDPHRGSTDERRLAQLAEC